MIFSLGLNVLEVAYAFCSLAPSRRCWGRLLSDAGVLMKGNSASSAECLKADRGNGLPFWDNDKVIYRKAWGLGMQVHASWFNAGIVISSHFI